MSILSAVEGALGKTVQVVEPVLEKVLGKTAAQNFEALALSVFNNDIGILVKDTVALVSTFQITDANGTVSFANGATQRSAALKILEADSKVIAENVSTSVLNLLIEVAVQWVAKGGAAVAAAAAAGAVAA